MKNCISLIFFISLSVVLYSQSQDEQIYRNQIKFSAFRMLDFVNPGIEVGYERMFNESYSTEFSFALMRDYAKISKYMDMDGIRLSLEQKFFYSKQENMRYFHAVELVYCHTSFKEKIRYVKRDSYAHTADADSYADIYSLDKRKYILNFKTGVQMSFKRFMLGMTAGLGLKYRKILHSDKNEIRPKYRKSIGRLVFGNFPTDEGEVLTLTLPINLKLAFLF